MSRYRFALRPKWILSHLFVLTMVVVMINLGLWQINRLHEKRDRNADVTARTDQPVAEAADLAEPGDFDGADHARVPPGDGDRHLPGRPGGAGPSRSRDSAPGSWVLTPLRARRRHRAGREPRLDLQRRRVRGGARSVRGAVGDGHGDRAGAPDRDPGELRPEGPGDGHPQEPRPGRRRPDRPAGRRGRAARSTCSSRSRIRRSATADPRAGAGAGARRGPAPLLRRSSGSSSRP